MTTLHFTARTTGQRAQARRIYSAQVDNILYTAGVNADGTGGIVMVGRFTPGWETLHFRSFCDTRVHPDELKKYLQGFADQELNLEIMV